MTPLNLDGLVGPTHLHSALSYGNRASMANKERIANPQAATLQGLKKMKLLADLGVPQALYPPHERPSLPHLRRFGFSGKECDIVKEAYERAPHILALCSSASSMWAANTATFTPACDTEDGRSHFTIANLAAHLHRSLESEETYALFQTLFPHSSVHPPLPKGGNFGDEGAANHIRFENGLHLFVYGHTLEERGALSRQCREASEAVIRAHTLPPEKAVCVRQSRKAIEKGVFHNDLISMGNGTLFLYHEQGFEEEVTAKLPSLHTVCIYEEQLALEEAVRSYLFNSQIVRKGEERILVAPQECAALDLAFLPFDQILTVDLRESMLGGGGPACLSLPLLLTEEEFAAFPPNLLLTPDLYTKLTKWARTTVRDRLTLADLTDPLFLDESRFALEQLTEILQIGSYYSFQRSH